MEREAESEWIRRIPCGSVRIVPARRRITPEGPDIAETRSDRALSFTQSSVIFDAREIVGSQDVGDSLAVFAKSRSYGVCLR